MTEEFLGLDDVTRGCHRNELEQCETKTYLEKSKLQCNCIADILKTFFPEEKVSLAPVYFVAICLKGC